LEDAWHRWYRWDLRPWTPDDDAPPDPEAMVNQACKYPRSC
jgi:hypothetical protein